MRLKVGKSVPLAQGMLDVQGYLSFQIRMIRDQSTFAWAIELEGLCVARPPPSWLAAIVPAVEQFAYSMLSSAFS